MWDPYSPTYKTLTEPETADLAVSETKSSIDFAAELGAPFVTIAVAIHAPIDRENAHDCTAVAVDALQRMARYAGEKGVRLVFEATNHLEMGKFVNTALNHKRMIELTGCDNIGIQLDWFHANFEELNPYEAVMDASPLLWHMHFRDSNSLTPGYGTVDFKAVLRAVKKSGYRGYCTLESSPMVPDADTAAWDGIEYTQTAGAHCRLSDQHGIPKRCLHHHFLGRLNTMELYRHLKDLDAQGKPIRVGLVGCGQMGSGMAHVTSRMPGMVTAALADIDPNRPLQVLRALEVPDSEICITNRVNEAEDALRRGKYLVTEDGTLLARLPSLDAVVEATGDTEIGARVAWDCVLNGKNIIMLNVETDVTVGYLLNRMAKQAGVVYTVASGDEPAVCKMLYDFAGSLI
jgi:sugar phosphate isomerase/epimerase